MKRSESGVALMMVLWVMLLLSLLALEFAHSMRMETEVTKNFRDEVQAYYLARGGIELARYELAICGNDSTHYRDPETGFYIFGKGDAGEVLVPPDCRVSELGKGYFEYKFESAPEKYPLNELAKNESALKKFLEKYCQIEPFSEEWSMITLSIMDWVDEDTTSSAPGIGAEDDWYKWNEGEEGNEADGYECKDAPFDSVDELRLIRGLRPEREDHEEEIARKKKIRDMFKRYFGVKPELESYGGRTKPFSINSASPEMVDLLHELGIINDLPETIAAKRTENGGFYNNDKYGYYYVISSAFMKSSGVQRRIKASFFDVSNNFLYAQPLYWNDNYFPEYDDPNGGEIDLDTAQE